MATGSNSDDPLIGQTISGRYRIISRLGAGGMGTAYRAWDEQSGVPVVIKIPKNIFFEDPLFAERFRREIRLLRGLVHPHIVPLVDEGEYEGLPFVVMRFLPGGSLANRRLRDAQGKVRPNPPGMLWLWLPAVAEALDAIHAGGVVHRDVKPANIFFDAGWGAFVGDFGIAKIITDSEVFEREQTLTTTGLGIGTPEYMAPEQFAPKAMVDGRADQYALAVIVYEMLAGARPFTGESANLILEVMTQPAPRLSQKRSGLPLSLITALDRGLAKRPEGRFTTCREFANAVLKDVPLLEDELGVARLLCPKCGHLLKLAESAAGRTGKCPKCKSDMKVAADLGAMWLLDEARRQEEEASVRWTALGGSVTGDWADSEPSLDALQPESDTTLIRKAARRSRQGALAWLDGHGLIVGGLLALAVLIPWIRSMTPDPSRRAANQKLKQQVPQLTSDKSLRERLAASEGKVQKLQQKLEELQAELAVARSALPSLNTATLDAAVGDAANLCQALGTIDKTEGAYGKLRTDWYRALARVAEELIAVENAAVTMGRPLAGAPDSVVTLHKGICSRELLAAELAVLAPQWLRYYNRGSDGIVLELTFGESRHLGPYWRTEAEMRDGDGTRAVTLISRNKPAAVRGDALLVIGLVINDDVIWAADIRRTATNQ